LRSATHGFSYVVHIRRCTAGTAGYVTKYCTKLLAESDIGTRPDGSRVRVNRVRYSKHFFPSPTAVMKAAFRASAAEKRGEDAALYEGKWQLQEVAAMPRDDDGRVITEVAQEQYRRLVAERVREASAETMKLSKGGKHVLAFMVLESLQRGEVATV
jgi:hypothetical protein